MPYLKYSSFSLGVKPIWLLFPNKLACTSTDRVLIPEQSEPVHFNSIPTVARPQMTVGMEEPGICQT